MGCLIAESRARSGSPGYALLVVASADSSGWGDEEEAGRWSAILARIAAQERVERGVDEPISLVADDGDLLAHFGPVKFLVASSRDIDSLPDQDDLFEQIDEWIVFERPAGPGVLLPRDRAVIDARQRCLAISERAWPGLISLLVRDVEATTSLRVSWHLEPRDEERVVPFHEAATFVRFGGPPLAKRKLLVPELCLVTDRLGSFVLHDIDLDDRLEASLWLFASLAEWVQQAVIDEVWGAWPVCSQHGHPLDVETAGGRVSWVCPQGSVAPIEVGSLS
jgi:hypothetical protein